MGEPIKIFIGLPCGELARFSSFWQSREGLDLTGFQVRSAQAQGLYIENNQNILARNMMEHDFDYFWLLNDDMIIPTDTLQKLVKRGKDVVTPLLVGHDIPHEPLFYTARDDDNYFHLYLEPGQRGLVRGLGSGGGGMLISRRVFEAFPDPWWERHIVRVQAEHSVFVSSTEDLDFCRKIEDAGFEMWCDLDCPIGHTILMNVWPVRLADGSWGTSYERRGKHVIIPAALNPEKHEIPIEESITA